MKYKASIDEWIGNIDKGSSFDLDINGAESNLKKLDGKKTSQLLVVSENKKNSLLIGGGNGGLYVVAYTVGNDEEFYNLINKNTSGEKEIELVTGGQAGIFSEKYCVKFNDALEALQHYLETGEISHDMKWESE